jgi:hypothetical protein
MEGEFGICMGRDFRPTLAEADHDGFDGAVVEGGRLLRRT